MFVAYMDRAGHACAMVWTYVSALSHAHRMADMSDPTTKFWVKKMVDAAGSQARTSAPAIPSLCKFCTSWWQQHGGKGRSMRHL